MNNVITEGIQKLYIGKDISEVLDMISINVWDRIAFARGRRGFKIYETTITQDILHHIALASDVSDNGIKLFEAKSEKTNGNDIECYIKVNGGFLFFAIQAKLMYSDDSYSQISHQRNDIDQIDLLINYAREKKGYPLYFLYNGLPDQMSIDKIMSKTDYHPKQYGVSFTSAYHIKSYQGRMKNKKGEPKWLIPSFYSLHPEYADPFIHFVNKYEGLLNTEEILYQHLKYPSIDYEIDIVSKEQLLKDDSWIDLTPNNNLKSDAPKDRVGEEKLLYAKNPTSIEQFNTQDIENGFNPKFRLIFSRNDN